jgi:hypothetical protein
VSVKGRAMLLPPASREPPRLDGQVDYAACLCISAVRSSSEGLAQQRRPLGRAPPGLRAFPGHRWALGALPPRTTERIGRCHVARMSQEPAECAGTGRDDTGRGGISTPNHSGRLRGKGAILLKVSHRPARVRFPPPPARARQRGPSTFLATPSFTAGITPGPFDLGCGTLGLTKRRASRWCPACSSASGSTGRLLACSFLGALPLEDPLRS